MPTRARVQTPQEGARPPVVGTVPFTSAAHEYNEPFGDTTTTPGAAAVQVGPLDVPAQGYLRNIWLLVTATGGTLGAGVLSADYPFNFFQQISLTDVNGAPLFGPIDGYAAMWANIFGGVGGGAKVDPRSLPSYVGTINATFAIRIPVEISHHDGLGALANQNAAAAYKLQYTVNPSATLFSTAPTTVPAFRVRPILEAWTLPNDLDVLGRPQAQLPPRHGTSQYTSQFIKAAAIGANSVLLPRVGNLIRWLGVIARTGAGARADNVFMDPVQFQWDARIVRNIPQTYITDALMSQKIPGLVTRDAGVFLFPMNNSQNDDVGDDDPTLWYPTVQSSRLELDGSSVAAGNLQVVTNDVAPVEVAPEERYVETSQTGYHPPVGIAASGTQ